MNRKQLFLTGLVILLLLAAATVVVETIKADTASNFADTVRQATAGFQDVKAAEAAGYQLFHGCVNGPDGGAMGIHYVNAKLVGDGQLDPQHPEALLYEDQNGTLRLVGVEYVVIGEAWNAKNQTPPVLMGQLFNYDGSPNRFAIPNYYYLHVWAWKNNPNGMFANWNPLVSCDDFNGTQ
jgi:hypothetical protein